MLRPPPTSTLFPYTSSSDLVPEMPLVGSPRGMGSGTYARSGSEQERPVCAASSAKTARISRSEEHTSELQSRQYLVCRLLLEKKKKRVCRERGVSECERGMI